MTQQDDITQRVLTDDEINTAIDWPAANTTMRAENDRAMAREVEAAVLRKLSKLRAPVADERAAFETAMQNRGQNVDRWPNPHGGYRRLSTEIAWYAWNDRAALASAPVAESTDRAMLQSVLQDLEKSESVCPRCGHSDSCADMDVVYMIRDHLKGDASAPVAGEQPIKLSDDVLHFLKEGVENATQCEEADVDHEFADQLLLLMHTPLYTGPRPKQRKVDWGPLVVAPVAGEAQPSDADLLVLWEVTSNDGDPKNNRVKFGRALLSRYAAPQASECECSRKSKAVSDSEAQL